MTDERLEQLAELRESIDVTAQAFEAGTAALRPVSHRDPSGAIRVRLDADGSLDELVIADDWKQRGLDPASLAGAVRAAIDDAGLQRLSSWAVATAEASAEPLRPRPAPEPTYLNRLLAAAGDQVDPNATSRLIDELTALLDQTEQLVGTLTGLADVEHVGEGAAGRVRATCDGNGELVDLAYDEGWARSAPGTTISRETTTALRAAVAAAQRQRMQAETGGSPLQAFLADPERIGSSLRGTA